MSDEETAARIEAVRAAMAATPAFALNCGHCRRPLYICNNDRRGCGGVPAQDADEAQAAPVVEQRAPTKPETWRDRPPLL